MLEAHHANALEAFCLVTSHSHDAHGSSGKTVRKGHSAFRKTCKCITRDTIEAFLNDVQAALNGTLDEIKSGRLSPCITVLPLDSSAHKCVLCSCSAFSGCIVCLFFPARPDYHVFLSKNIIESIVSAGTVLLRKEEHWRMRFVGVCAT